MEQITARMRQKWKLADTEPVGVKAVVPESRFDATNRTLVMTVNTADVDLEDEVVLPAGALEQNGGSMHYFMANRKFLLNHDYSGMAVGALRGDPTLKSGGWYCKCVVGKTDDGDAIVALAEDGIYPAASIGFLAMSYGPPTDADMKAYGPHSSIVKAWHWLETSLTYMPMNVACQAQDQARERSFHKEEVWEAMSKAVGAGRIKQKSAERLGLPAKKLWAVPRRIFLT